MNLSYCQWVAFATRFFLYVHALPYMFQCALGNGSCFLRPKVIVMYGYSYTLQVTDIAGHIISCREVNELHPCIPAVCQYKIVFHALFFYGLSVSGAGGIVYRHTFSILSFRQWGYIF